MDRFRDPHVYAAPSTLPGHVHRSTHNLRFPALNPPTRGHSHTLDCLSRPQGGLGNIQLPILTSEATFLLSAKTLRVPTFKYPILAHDMGKWKSRVIVGSYTAIYLSTAMARTLIDSLSTEGVNGPTNPPPNPQRV